METMECDRCGEDVAITRVDGQVQETDDSGRVICDPCAEGKNPGPLVRKFSPSHMPRPYRPGW